MRKKNILIVDDEPGTLRLVSTEVKAAGYHVQTALSGKECLERVKKNRTDLILLDLLMPGMDGYDVVDVIKKDKDTQEIPIIILTAKDSENDHLESIKAGALYFISKPYSPSDLLVKIKVALESRAD
jgi:CheY-like chemotaxis protein